MFQLIRQVNADDVDEQSDVGRVEQLIRLRDEILSQLSSRKDNVEKLQAISAAMATEEETVAHKVVGGGDVGVGETLRTNEQSTPPPPPPPLESTTNVSDVKSELTAPPPSSPPPRDQQHWFHLNSCYTSTKFDS